MPALLFKKQETGFSTPIADEFILHQMPKANGNYVKVYLYVFHLFFRAEGNFSTRDVAAALGLLESDVLQALQYWHEEKALSLTIDGEQLWLSFVAPSTTPPSGPQGQPSDATKVVRVEHKPAYSPEEINIYEQNPLIKDLFETAAHLLGEQFSFPNLSLLFSFYDYYRLPVNVIKYLLEYCVQGGNRSLRYMEKVVQDWSDRGIKTVEAAKAHVRRFEIYRPILKALGIAERQPSPAEIELMDRWLYQYNCCSELILEAASRTVRKTGKPSFKYMDSILKSWADNQVRTLEDVSRADEAFAAKRFASGSEPGHFSAPRSAKGPFHTYIARDDWDFDRIEKQAQDRLYSGNSSL